MRTLIKLWEGTTMDYFFFEIEEDPESLYLVAVDDNVDDDIEKLREIGFEVVRDVNYNKKVSTWEGDNVSGYGRMVYVCRKTRPFPELPEFIEEVSKFCPACGGWTEIDPKPGRYRCSCGKELEVK